MSSSLACRWLGSMFRGDFGDSWRWTVPVLEKFHDTVWLSFVMGLISFTLEILIAIPLYVECIPGLLMEFLETVTPKTDGSKLAFILQSGFAEGIQLRCGEEYLEMLAERLGCKYVGTLVKGDNFSIRMFEGKQQERLTLRYKEMGVEFGKEGNFLSEKCRAFTGPEVFSAPMRIFIGIMFKTVVKNGFKNTSLKWGCTKPLDYRPY